MQIRGMHKKNQEFRYFFDFWTSQPQLRSNRGENGECQQPLYWGRCMASGGRPQVQQLAPQYLTESRTVVPNRENPPNIMKFLTCYIIDSYWNSDLADSENGIFELFRSPNSAQKRSDFHLSALKILIFHFLYSKISMEGFKKVVFPNQRAPKSRIWVVQIKPYSILVAPETLHFWASANILRLLIELVFNFWQKLGIHFEFWTCWFDRIFLTFYFSSNRNV